MGERKAWVEVLRKLWDLEAEARSGWVVLDDLLPQFQQAVDAAVGQGLVESADRETLAELSAPEDRPVSRAVRLSAAGFDALIYADAEPAPAPRRDGPADDEKLVELRPAEMDAVRRYVRLSARLRVPPADGLAERVRTSSFDRAGNRWSLFLNAEQIESVAYAFYLRSVGGPVTEANRFARLYGVIFRANRETGALRSKRLPRSAAQHPPTGNAADVGG
ncbi:DUF6417 family protein [Streptomyces sp. NPDC047017]|uniref:DUF6417 family protein n=1 Tax=Streptomyces sp. NPDC047017 TaxID=3155024 RepID=UPI0033DF2726